MVDNKDIPQIQLDDYPRGRFIGSEGGFKVFERPPLTVLKGMTKEDPRIKYVPIGDAWFNSIAGMKSSVAIEGVVGLNTGDAYQVGGSPVFLKDLITNSVEEVRKKAGGNFEVRGAATYLNNESSGFKMPTNGYVLFNPLRALKEGREGNDQNLVRTYPVVATGPQDWTWSLRSTGWAVRHAQEFRKELEGKGLGEQAEKIFPTMMLFKREDGGLKMFELQIFDFVIEDLKLDLSL